MTRFIHLPVELVERVISTLATTIPQDSQVSKPLFEVAVDGRRAMATLSRCSRLLHKLVQPFLYKHVCIGKSQAVPQVVALLRYWDSHPEIAAYVQSIFVHWIELACHMEGKLYVFSQDDAFFLRNLAQKFGVTLTHGWPNNIYLKGRRFSSGLGGLLLLQARSARLIDIAIVGNDTDLGTFIPSMPKNPSDSLLFKSLTHLRIDVRTTSPIEYLSPLIKLMPNINTFECNRCISWEEETFDWSGVSRLALRFVRLKLDTIPRVIMSCRTLVDFAFVAHTPASPQPIIEALAQHIESLRALEIDFGGLYLMDGSSGNHPANLDLVSPVSLRDFYRLEVLKLWCWDLRTGSYQIFRTMPDSLRELHVYGDIRNYEEEFKLLVTQVRTGKLPNLKVVQVDSCREVAGQLFIQTIRTMLAEVGVLCLDKKASWTWSWNKFCPIELPPQAIYQEENRHI
ncbi:uncharacterized protein CTRU02_202837 [Colletotrichum truncatum]|uniref:Uncharacterized protein n=1 Tax=Colletotrichum truncatum TaxID=5467 RepID=A0ACC3ZLG2_COLTU|nr:uncharacterized protein CTRU02_12931 [Colletotrichum truncatum]KAF6783915.1 hypothetical protein CTRU02_12931 [Colletotrichum truncatum]